MSDLSLLQVCIAWNRVVHAIRKKSEGGALLAEKGSPTCLERLRAGGYAITLTYFDSFCYERMLNNHKGRIFIERQIADALGVPCVMLNLRLWKPEEIEEDDTIPTLAL